MQIGKQYEVEIIDLGTDGDGIGRIEGIAVFVPGAFPGDVLLVEITSIKKKFARGRVVEQRKAASLREQPSCPNADLCGGCQMQGMHYEGQLRLKEKWVRDRLAHIGGVEDPLVRPILGMEEPIRYRNKAFFPVGRLQGSEKKERGCSVGFYQAKSMKVVNCDTCILQEETAERVAEVIRHYVKQTKIPIFDKETGTGVLRGVMVRTAFGTGQVMVILVATERRLPMVEWLVEELERALSELSREIGQRLETQWAQTGRPEDAGQGEDYGFFLESVILNVNKKKGQGGLGADCITLAGQPVITDYSCGLELEISPLSFYQVNPIQMEVLYEKAAEYAGLTGKETVFDLYCGVGTMGLTMAGKAGRLLGIEAVRSAVLNANRNAVLNGIVNARFVCGKAEEALPRILAEGMEWDGGERINLRPDVILLDPPRNGCEESLLKAAASAGPKRIVYVSCDPATLARDVKVLCQLGYALVEAQPVDLFPWTLHVETVVLLSKGEIDSKKVRVEFSLEDMDMSEFQDGATYPQIKEYVLEHTGLKVSSLYISQIKRKCGLEVGKNYNLPKSEDSRQPQCPPEKEKAIREALKYFGMI